MSELQLHPKYAMSQTSTHVFFVGGPFSQWYTSHFTGQLAPDTPVLEFTSAEQYMMASKAWLFQDLVMTKQIMQSHSPREQKELGRRVAGFDLARWNANAKNIVRRGSFYKYSQDEELRAFLKQYDGLYIVEGADYDPVWGVKLAWDDPRIVDPANWRGTNWLGECIMECRDPLDELEAKTDMGYEFDPFTWQWVNASTEI